MRHRIVLDTDIGSDADDALCLALALAAPEIELVAVTHVTGDTRLRAAISRRLLDLAGRRDVPVYAGRERPLDGRGRFIWFGHEGLDIVDRDALPAAPDEHAVDVLCRLFRTRDDLELVTIGPLTNIAAALEAEPAIAGCIRQLTAMGGFLRQAGCAGAVFGPAMDYNLCGDVAASMRVLGAGIPIRLVPIDVTTQVWVEEHDVCGLEQSLHPLHRAVARAVRRWTPINRAFLIELGARPDVDNAAFLHDPLALACAYDESFCSFADLSVTLAVEDGLFRLREQHAPTAQAVRLRCAVEVDRARFLSHCRTRLGLAG